MCGIIGRIGCPEGENFVKSGLKIQNRRGPDFTGHIKGIDWELGHNRLAILDLSDKSNQPFTKNKVSLVFNGEIYNYKSLRSSLVKLGHSFSTDGDTEVLMAMYKEYGLNFIHHLYGMYALAIVDEQLDIFILARDRVGQKPLFYSINEKGVTFASELRVFARNGHNVLSKQGLLDYLELGYFKENITLLSSVKSILPGEMLVFKNLASPRLKQKINKKFLDEEKVRLQCMSLKDVLSEVLFEYVRSDVPLTTLLSGGLDSSLILGLMSQKSGLYTSVNVRMPSSSGLDESQYARQISEFFESQHKEVNFGELQYEIFEEKLRNNSEPLNDSSFAAMDFMFKSIKDTKHTVAIGGDGADELFYGYKHYKRLFILMKIRKLIGVQLLHIISIILRSLPFRIIPSRYFNVMDKNDQVLPFPVSRIVPNVADIVTFKSQSRSGFSGIRNDKNLVRNHRNYDIRNYLPGDILRKGDMASMNYSIELRSPFLDDRIYYYANKISKEFSGILKTDLKKIAKEILPKEYNFNRKQGFLTPLDDWLRIDSTVKNKIWLVISKLDFIESSYISEMRKTCDKTRDRDNEVYGLLALSLWIDENFAESGYLIED